LLCRILSDILDVLLGPARFRKRCPRRLDNPRDGGVEWLRGAGRELLGEGRLRGLELSAQGVSLVHDGFERFIFHEPRVKNVLRRRRPYWLAVAVD
jgi:hypothetical protein